MLLYVAGDYCMSSSNVSVNALLSIAVWCVVIMYDVSCCNVLLSVAISCAMLRCAAFYCCMSIADAVCGSVRLCWWALVRLLSVAAYCCVWCYC